MGKRIFITVAEVSGDQHAAHLIEHLRRLDPSLIIEGHGGPAMAAAGTIIHRETVGRAAMGWKGALRAMEIFRILRWTRRYFRHQRPDLQICVDSPAMNFHFARAARASGIPVLYYIAPQLWAWREGRMKKLRAYVDRLACILPFEEEYFLGHGVNATFVGHPLFDQLGNRDRVSASGAPSSPQPAVGLLPGSRTSEAEHNFPHLLKVAEQILAAIPDAHFLVPTTPATDGIVRQLLQALPDSLLAQRIEREMNAFNRLVPRCDLCITVSGTATLHVAGLGVPMIVVYRTSPLLWHAAGRWLVKTRTFALVNVLAAGKAPGRSPAAGEHIVPEFIPWYGDTRPVAEMAIDYLRHPEKRAHQRERLKQLVSSLDRPGASERVARMAIEMMNQPASEIRSPASTTTP